LIKERHRQKLFTSWRDLRVVLEIPTMAASALGWTIDDAWVQPVKMRVGGLKWK
jgi:hypothetical protein